MTLEGHKGEDGTCPTCGYNGVWGWYMTNRGPVVNRYP